MEMKLEEAQVCRLCGQCESIYIDVFGEEGTKRFLGLKIHTKINIVIDETDPLPKAICVQCLGKLEFVCDFQEECLRTQEVLRDRYNLPPLSDVDEIKDEDASVPASTSTNNNSTDKNLNPPLETEIEITNAYETAEAENAGKPRRKTRCLRRSRSRSENEKTLGENPRDPGENVNKRWLRSRNSTASSATTTTTTTTTTTANPKSSDCCKTTNASIASRLRSQSDSPEKKDSATKEPEVPKETPDKSTEDTSMIQIPTSALNKVLTVVSTSPDMEVSVKESTNRNGDIEDISFTLELRRKKRDSEFVTVLAKVFPDQGSCLVGSGIIGLLENENNVEIDKIVSTILNGGAGRTKNGTSGLTKILELDEMEKRLSASQNPEELFRIDGEEIRVDDNVEHVTVDNQSGYSCKLCRKVYERRDKCTVHVKTHLGIKQYACTLCCAKFVCKSDVMKHIRCSHTNPRPMQCPKCPKRFRSKFDLTEHDNVHKGIKPYRCTDCGQSYHHKVSLQMHVKSHLPPQNLACEYCGKIFPFRTRLLSHIGSVHLKNRRNFRCRFCYNLYSSLTVLNDHIKTRHATTYTCDVCSKTFKVASKYKAHVLQHSNPKPFVCNVCNNRYASKAFLNEHLLKHEGLRKHVCPLCGATFAQASHLAAHRHVHGEKTHACPECGRKFNRRDNMKVHRKRHFEKTGKNDGNETSDGSIPDTNSNEKISETDGLSHNVCMRCIGTLEFIEDFHQNCHITQQKFIEAKKAKKCPKIKENFAPDLEDDVESDKENASPNVKIGLKRKRQPINHEKTKAEKPKPLSIKTMNKEDSEKSRVDKQINKSLTQKTVHVSIEPCDAVKSTSSITNAKCDNSTKTQTYEKKEEKPSTSRDYQSTDRKSKTRGVSRNGLVTKKPQSQTNTPTNSPKSKQVPVIVKLEKKENLEVSDCNTPITVNQGKSNKDVWLANVVNLPEADKPKSTRSEKQHDQCPTAGDEAEESSEKTPEKSSTRSPGKEITLTENVRKSVIETPQKAFDTIEKYETPCGRETRQSSSGLKKNKAPAEEVAEEGGNESESIECRKKFARISDLISEEQKQAIETYYKVDMSVVDGEVVTEKIIFLEKKKFGCKICDATFPRQDKCQVHIWGHLEMKPFKCNACGFATVTVSNIRCHIRKSHLKIKPYACELCEKKYVTAFLLEEHMNSHTGSRPYSCTVCDFTSASRQVLSYHNATHKPTKDITCDECGRQFYSKARMRAHMVIHNKDRADNMCKLCSIYLCNNEALQRHIKNVHSKHYYCKFCDKRCKSKKALNNHQNVHYAAKYKCTLCSNVYKSSHILKEHLLKHEGIRKYKCTVCEKDFAQQSHLAAHMAVHSDRRFYCPGCNRAFNRHDNMKMHTKRCDAFLANPELQSLLTIRRSRSKPTEELPKSSNLNSSSEVSVETANTIENRERPSTDGIFLKAQLVETDS